jgi:hypothetical protein
MRIKRFTLVALMISMLLWVACDSSDSVDLPDYFVKYYGEEGNQEGVDMIANADGTFYLFGNSTLPDQNQQLYLVKADAKGNMIWARGKHFGGVDFVSQARDIELTSDGRLIMAAVSTDANGDTDALLIITDLDGNKLDSVRYGYAGTEEDIVSVTQVTGGFIATGSTSNTSIKANQISNDSRDMLCLRFHDDLTIYDPLAWIQTLGPGTYDAGVKTLEAGPGLFYFFGYSNRPHGSSSGNMDFVIYQMNNDGNPKGSDIFSGTLTEDDERLTSVTIGTLESGVGFLLSGISTDRSGNSAVYISKMTRTFNSDIPNANLAQNFQFAGPLSFSLGNVTDIKTSSFPSSLSGFLVLSNDNNQGKENFSLTKITSGGKDAWSNPGRLIFGGVNKDVIGSVAELPDGKIIMIGTFEVGDDLQKKMALIKVDKEGKFRD